MNYSWSTCQAVIYFHRKHSIVMWKCLSGSSYCIEVWCTVMLFVMSESEAAGILWRDDCQEHYSKMDDIDSSKRPKQNKKWETIHHIKESVHWNTLKQYFQNTENSQTNQTSMFRPIWEQQSEGFSVYLCFCSEMA